MSTETPRFDLFWQYVEHWGSLAAEHMAMRLGEKRISNKEFNQITDKLAEAFIGFGVEKGDTIATILPSCPEFVCTFVAASKLSAITVPMDVRYRISDLRRFIHHVEPRVVVSLSGTRDNEIVGTLKSLRPELRDIEYIIVGHSDFGKPFEEVLKMELNLEDELKVAKATQSPEDDILIIFTGGTTGIPKATLLSHKNVVSMCNAELEVLQRFLAPKGVTGRMKNLAALPPSHVGGTLEVIGTGVVGGHEMIFLDHWSPYPVLEITQQEKLPLIGGVPTMFAILLSLPDLEKYDLSSLKLAIVSGEKVSLELLTRIREKICDTIVVGYGSTEAGTEVTFTEPSDDIVKLAEGYVGKPLPRVEIKIVDENDEPLPPSEVGEILVRSPMTSKGYFRQPKEDKKGFTPDGFCRTGDLGYLNENGGLYIVNRKKCVIRVGSYTVLPQEIEELVLKNPNVAMAAAIGVPHEIYGEVVWLFIAPKPEGVVDEKEIIEMCKRELADFKVPRKVVISELPTTRIGKVDRVRLRKEAIKPLQNKPNPVRA
jgi:acyl-CoA synthetase (AMP-forming)/AMP-acid ligase II